MQIEDHVTSLCNKYGGEVEINQDELTDQIEQAESKFDFSTEEAATFVEHKLTANRGITSRKTAIEGKEQVLGNLNKERLPEDNQYEKWVNVTATVTSLWEPSHDNQRCVGLLEDQTAIKKFVLWEQGAEQIDTESDQILEEGETYHLRDVVTKHFNDQIELKINKESAIEQVDTQMELGYNQIVGQVTSIPQRATEAITTRCSHDDCQNVVPLESLECEDHGQITLTTDNLQTLTFELPCIISDGTESQKVMFTDERAGEFLDIDTAAFTTEIKDILNTEVDTNVSDELGRLNKQIQSKTDPKVGTHVSLRVKENPLSNQAYVITIEDNPPAKTGNIDNLLVKARELKAALDTDHEQTA